MNWKRFGRSSHGLIEVLFCLEGLKKTQSQDCWCPGQDTNSALSKHKSRALPLHQFVLSDEFKCNVMIRLQSCSSQ